MATLLIAAIVASSAAIAGDVMQDLKTGHMLGATPKRQQVAEHIQVKMAYDMKVTGSDLGYFSNQVIA